MFDRKLSGSANFGWMCLLKRVPNTLSVLSIQLNAALILKINLFSHLCMSQTLTYHWTWGTVCLHTHSVFKMLRLVSESNWTACLAHPRVVLSSMIMKKESIMWALILYLGHTHILSLRPELRQVLSLHLMSSSSQIDMMHLSAKAREQRLGLLECS